MVGTDLGTNSLSRDLSFAQPKFESEVSDPVKICELRVTPNE
jgi:hypothetical protein